MMVENKKEEKKDETNYTFIWVIIILLILIIIGLNIFFKIVEWKYVLYSLLGLLLICISRYAYYKFAEKKEITQTIYQGKKQVPTPEGTEYIIDMITYWGLTGDFSNCDRGEILSSKAVESTADIDTNVIMTKLDDLKTKDTLYIFMEGEMNDVFDKIESLKRVKNPLNKRDWHYINLLKQLKFQIKKNIPEEKEEKEVRNTINDFAQKSRMDRYIEFDAEGNIIKERYLYNEKPKKEEVTI